MFHTKGIQTTLSDLNATSNGLTTQEVQIRQKHFGKNILPQGKQTTLFQIFLQQFKNPIIYVLIVAAVISLVIKEFSDAGFIMAVLLINAAIGTYQEYQANKSAQALKKMIKTYIFALRDGKKVEIPSEDVTIGDILFFESGVKVPADVRLIQSKDLFVNESLLTGESIDVSKDANYISSDIDEPVGDRKNMLYAGSLITKGRAIGVVTAIAGQTEVGKISELLVTSETTKPPLIIRMEKFSFNLLKVLATVILIVICIGFYQGIGVKELFFFSVALVVSATPEGLPVAITVALSAASASMSKRNVIVRKLSAIEGLGSCTLIASDKTGTMTKNMLSVENFIPISNSNDIQTNALLCAMLCNEATFIQKNTDFIITGDQVDVALLKYVLHVKNELFQRYQHIKPLQEIPYEPQNGYAAVKCILDRGTFDFIKGAPEIIVHKSSLNPAQKEHILSAVNAWAEKGFRNIALAYKQNDSEKIANNGYVYLGFVTIIDPLRDGVHAAVKTAQEAGVKVIMVTGDHPNTAYYIAKELSIAIDKAEVIDGAALSHAQENQILEKTIADKKVFARVSPEQKQIIVNSFQKQGDFVAVTGDGVNDAPALKSANIGIAMGKSGTDVARESSDLILTDDFFGSIVNGIEEGRIAYDNIRKVIYLLISTGFAEIVLVLLAILFALPVPLLPEQLLWLNLVTNGIQDVALGLEKGEPGVLKRKPRSPKEPIFNKPMISRVIVAGLYMGVAAFSLFYILLNNGYSVEAARNITLLLMVLFENVHVFNARSENHFLFEINHRQNKFLWISVIGAFGIHLFSMHNPFMQSVLGLQPVHLSLWILLISIALFLLLVMEGEKYIRKKIFSV
jgi:calcium-translocating P-type ATPase